MNTLALISLNALILFTSIIALWLISIKIKDVSIIDMFFGIAMAMMAVISFYFANGEPIRKNLLLALTIAWALRYSIHIISRNWGHGEDRRYSKLRQWVKKPEDFKWLSLKLVFLYQASVFLLMSLPTSIGMSEGANHPIGLIGLIGTCIALLGILLEAIADYQLKQFKAQRLSSETVLNTGLWRYSRHPNYFGNACVWWGLWLISCEVPWGIVSIIGPISITYFLVKVTGKATLEKKLLKSKPQYAQYIESTSGFIPWFTKKTS